MSEPVGGVPSDDNLSLGFIDCKVEGWDRDGNCLECTFSNGVVTFNIVPTTIRYTMVVSQEDEAVSDE